MCTFILPVAPSDADTIKVIVKRKKAVLGDISIMVSSLLVITCFLALVSFCAVLLSGRVPGLWDSSSCPRYRVVVRLVLLFSANFWISGSTANPLGEARGSPSFCSVNSCA
ncbi:MAG: hypothetical protein GQ541_05175 [Desulfovibrionaceae bacterium]|nr:hypothetical protein [Desulfovibrionaceae bacterium]